MLHRFIRHIKEGFIGIIRHFAMSISTMSAVMITLLLVGVFLILTYNLQTMTHSIEDSINIIALIDYDSESEGSIKNIEKQILAITGVEKIEYRSKEEEFDYYVNVYADAELKEFNENYRDNNPFHDVFLVSCKDASQIVEVKMNIIKISGISSVEDGGSNTYTLVSILQNIRTFGSILIISLCLLAIYLVYNTIQIAISSRSDEIWIMRNVGAKNGYIRAPFLVEGVIIASIGSIIPIALVDALYYYLYIKSNGGIFNAFILVEPWPFLLYLSLILLALGILVGFSGSYISVCKSLKGKR